MTTTELTTTEPTTIEPTPKAETTEPIRPPDNPLQYRAIGLLRGKYVPKEGELTLGTLHTNDGVQIEAVILGKLLGLVKSRVDLSQEHLWICYPRTKDEDSTLQVHLGGIWEPQTLHPNSPIPTHSPQPDYFSIRGEVSYQHKDEGWLVVKINRAPRQPTDKPSYFKLKLQGFLPEKPVKNFWDLHVQREGSNLVIEDGERIAYLGEKKPKKGKPKKGKSTKGKQKSIDSEQSPVQNSSPKEPPKLKKKQPTSDE